MSTFMASEASHVTLIYLLPHNVEGVRLTDKTGDGVPLTIGIPMVKCESFRVMLTTVNTWVGRLPFSHVGPHSLSLVVLS
jgi:hypothetical protein